MDKNLLDRVAQLDRLSPSERRLAELFERDTPQVAFLNLTGVAERAGVGTATVTRFIRKLGYPGFVAFMKAMRETTAEAFDPPISHYVHTTHWDAAQTASASFFARISGASSPISALRCGRWTRRCSNGRSICWRNPDGRCT